MVFLTDYVSTESGPLLNCIGFFNYRLPCMYCRKFGVCVLEIESRGALSMNYNPSGFRLFSLSQGLAKVLRLAFNLQSSCFSLLAAGITSTCHYACLENIFKIQKTQRRKFALLKNLFHQNFFGTVALDHFFMQKRFCDPDRVVTHLLLTHLPHALTLPGACNFQAHEGFV